MNLEDFTSSLSKETAKKIFSMAHLMAMKTAQF